MIIWLASYPRSGNTYYRLLLHHAAGFESATIYDDSLMMRIGAAGIVGHKVRSQSLDELQAGAEPHFIKTHELPSDGNPAVYVVRDGRDVLVSYAHFLNDTAKSKQLLQRARRKLMEQIGIDAYRRTLAKLIVDRQKWGGWSNHVLSWAHNRRAAVTAIVRYEDLVAQPFDTLRRSLEELSIQPDAFQDRPPDFSELHRRWPGFFRKGVTGSWREEMPDDLQELFWEQHAAAMNAFGYNRNEGPPEQARRRE